MCTLGQLWDNLELFTTVLITCQQPQMFGLLDKICSIHAASLTYGQYKMVSYVKRAARTVTFKSFLECIHTYTCIQSYYFKLHKIWHKLKILLLCFSSYIMSKLLKKIHQVWLIFLNNYFVKSVQPFVCTIRILSQCTKTPLISTLVLLVSDAHDATVKKVKIKDCIKKMCDFSLLRYVFKGISPRPLNIKGRLGLVLLLFLFSGCQICLTKTANELFSSESSWW